MNLDHGWQRASTASSPKAVILIQMPSLTLSIPLCKLYAMMERRRSTGRLIFTWGLEMLRLNNRFEEAR